jgi:outer membrane protein insertion porin family
MKLTLCSLLLLLAFYRALPQDPDTARIGYFDYERPRDLVIAEVTVKGVKYLQTNYLVSLSGLNTGDEITIPGNQIPDAIDKLWALGLFADVKILATKIEGRSVYLEIVLREQPRLMKINLLGLNKTQQKDIEEIIKLKPGNQVTDNVLNNISTAIKKHYIEKGYFKCQVNIMQTADTSLGNRVTLDIKVDRGKRVKISDIDFIGNQVYKDKRLRATLKKTKQKTVNIFKPSKYIDEQYKEDKKKLIEFYNKNGYRDARIVSERLVDLNNRRIGIQISVDEGLKYYIRNINWVGNTKYPATALSKILGLSKGDVYNQNKIQERLFSDEDAITSAYMDEGYLFFSIDPVELKIEGDSIDLELQVSEGKPATINRILIRGNTKTNEHVIRREIRTMPGELFSKTDIIRTVRELAAMGHFNPENISPNPIPNMADGTVDIEYVLEERSNDQFEISGGWGGYGFVGTVGLRFSNFSSRNILKLKEWKPVPTGDGQTLSVRAQSNGRFYQAYNLSFVEPWFGGKKPNSFSTSFYYTITKPYRGFNEGRSSGYFKVLGASVGLGKRLKWPDDYFVLYNEIGFQQYHLNNYGSSFVITNGFSYVINFNITLSRSSQDQMIFPRKGSNFSLGLRLTPPYSAFRPSRFWKLNPNLVNAINDPYKVSELENAEKFKFIEYHKWTFKSAWYTSLVGNLVLSAKSEFGYLGFYNREIGYSPFEKFDVGGSGMMGYNLYGTDIVALRGYTDGSLTPQTREERNGYTQLINNGNVYTKYTMELRYPFSLNPSATLFGMVFLEAGNAWSRIEDFNPFGVKRAAGIGFRAFLPMFGMLGLDWGYGFDLPNTGAEPDEIRRGRHGGEFHFTMGQQF